MEIKDYISSATNSELVELAKDLKKSEKKYTDIFIFSKNFRHLLNIYREHKEISLEDFIVNLDLNVKNEIVERISKNKMIIY